MKKKFSYEIYDACWNGCTWVTSQPWDVEGGEVFDTPEEAMAAARRAAAEGLKHEDYDEGSAAGLYVVVDEDYDPAEPWWETCRDMDYEIITWEEVHRDELEAARAEEEARALEAFEAACRAYDEHGWAPPSDGIPTDGAAPEIRDGRIFRPLTWDGRVVIPAGVPFTPMCGGVDNTYGAGADYMSGYLAGHRVTIWYNIRPVCTE